MEPLKQSLKIGAAFAVIAGVGLLLLPETPSLLAGRAQTEAQSPPPSATQARGQQETLVAQAPAASAGQTHLQRLREAAGRATPPPAETEPPAEAAPAREPAAPAPPVEEIPAEEALPPPEAPQAASGPTQFRMFRAPDVADSATLLLDGRSVRLPGILPVSADARCADGSACGAHARDALADYVARQPVLCSLDAGHAATVAPCLSGEEDVGEWAVANGWALAEPGSPYEAAEQSARDEGQGIWAAGGL